MLPVIERMLAQYGQSRAVNLTRRKTVTPHGYLAVMGGALAYDGVMGVKTFTHTHNGYSFQVSLYDIDSGRLLLYTQANRLGQLRTGATTGVAVKHLAVGGAVKVGIIGTGNQAADQLRAISSVREVREIVAYSRGPENRRNFAERMSRELEITVIPGDINRDAVAKLRRSGRNRIRRDPGGARRMGVKRHYRDRRRPDQPAAPRGG